MPLYFAAQRPVVERDGTLIMVDDDRMPLRPARSRRCAASASARSAATRSPAPSRATPTTLPEIIQEMLLATTSERQGRVIDHDVGARWRRRSRRGTSDGQPPTDLIAADIDAYLDAHTSARTCCASSPAAASTTARARSSAACSTSPKLIYEDQLAALRPTRAGRHPGRRPRLRPARRRPGRRARAGHHHRRRLPLLLDRAAQVHRRRHARPRAVHPQHGHRRVHRRRSPVILIDARKGVLTQTRRHSFLVSLLGIRHVVVAVNKMDLVDYSQEVFERIEADYREFAAELGIDDITVIPMSALKGDNVVERSPNTPWYAGPTLLEHLETVEIDDDRARPAAVPPAGAVGQPAQPRLPRLLRPRSSAASVAPATVVACPSAGAATVERIVTFDGDLDEARRRPGRHPHPRRRDRRQPRRRRRRRRRAAGGGRPVRGPHRLDGRRGAAPRPALPAEDRHHRSAPRSITPKYQVNVNTLGAHRGQDPGAQRDRRLQPHLDRPVPSIPTPTTATWAASSSSTG